MSRDDVNLPNVDPDSDRTSQRDSGSDRGESGAEPVSTRPRSSRMLRVLGLVVVLLLIFAAGAFLFARLYFARAMRADLPQLDGTQVVYGLSAPVTVARDAHGVPHISAGSIDDLVFAQGYVTAQDRLWQMELLRRHASGELAAIFGRAMIEHDRVQRTLQLRAAADRAVAALPQDQQHWLVVYARGVNASIAAQHGHLPIEFRVLGYQPAAWTPRDSILVELAMFQDLTTSFPEKRGREALAAHLPPELMADLYLVGNWRDHPPGAPIPDMTAPQPEIKDVPLDESQSRLMQSSKYPAPRPSQRTDATPPVDLTTLKRTLALFDRSCDSCLAGSNGWAVAGLRTASGSPMLSNDMHLNLQVPGVWYEADLEAPLPAPLVAFHAAGVTLPGTPFIIAGHNGHVAWGFTNVGADVQDLYIEHTRGTPTPAPNTRPLRAANGCRCATVSETIHVRGGSRSGRRCPARSPWPWQRGYAHHLQPLSRREAHARACAGASTIRGIRVTSHRSSPSIRRRRLALHAERVLHLGRSAAEHGCTPTTRVTSVTTRSAAFPSARRREQSRAALARAPPTQPRPTPPTHEWAGYIPFDQLPQAFDPPDVVLATANARVTLDGYRFPITLDWMAPYRTERIYKVLEASAQRVSDDHEPGTAPLAVPSGVPATVQNSSSSHPLTSADMLALQTDVYSELDHVIAAAADLCHRQRRRLAEE